MILHWFCPTFYLNHLQNCKWHHGHFRFKMKTLVFRNKILNSFRSFFPTWHGYNCVSSVGVCISIVVLLSIGISIYSVQVVVIIINIIVNIYYLSDIDLLFQLCLYTLNFGMYIFWWHMMTNQNPQFRNFCKEKMFLQWRFLQLVMPLHAICHYYYILYCFLQQTIVGKNYIHSCKFT